MSDSTEPPALVEARKALAVLERHDAVGDRGDPIIELDIVIGQEMARRNAHVYLRAAFEEVDRLAAMVARLEPEADDARRMAADLSALRIEHGAVCGLLADTRRDRDEARARAAELEARPTFEAGVRAAAKALRDADDSRGSVALYGARRTILALLEPKP